jgi:CheY-like chemotaxis protein
VTADAPAGKRLLLVEDHRDAGDTVAPVLRQAGYVVETAGDGPQALDRLAADPLPDLIVLNVQLPVVDGLAFMRQLRGPDGTLLIPVVVVTGTSLTRAWARQTDCTGVVMKPVDHAELLSEVRRCVA